MRKQELKDPTKPLGERYYLSDSKRLYINVQCPRCKKIRTARWDGFKERKKVSGDKSFLCASCRSIKDDAYRSVHGYAVKSYKAFPVETWPILSKMCKKSKQIPVHRAIMAIHLGRPLRPDENIHHINGDKTDNRIENLKILSPSEHSMTHLAEALSNYSKIKEENNKLKEEICRLRKLLKMA